MNAKKPVLVIMAAGLGSRYGGLKQIAPVDARGHVIIDYSLFDARRAGFERAVCIVKPENEADFRAIIGDRAGRRIHIDYAFQRPDLLPAGYTVPEGRVKPWGTAHAVLCAADLIDGPFAVINADDFYGRSAFQTIYDFLSAPRDPSEQAMVGYHILNTLTENGHVARGVCETDADGFLVRITERTHIESRDGGAAFTEDGERFTPLPSDATVSMNLWGFHHFVLDEIRDRFPAFLDRALAENPLKAEYFLPSVVDQLLRENLARVRVLPTHEKWYGVTYREDMQAVQEAMARFCREGVYPERLWGE